MRVFANEHPLSPYQNQPKKNQLRNPHQPSIQIQKKEHDDELIHIESRLNPNLKPMNFPQNSLKHP